MKKTKIVLIDLRHINLKDDAAFKVKKLTNTIDYRIGEYLSITKVDKIIKNAIITVEIVDK